MGEQDKRSALLSVIAVNDRLFVVHARLSQIIRRIRKNIPIDRDVMLCLLFSDQFLRRDFPQLIERCTIVSPHQLPAGRQRLIKEPVRVRRLLG